MSAVLPSIRGYRMLRPLGTGGMGQVFLAEDETLGRRVAIKMIAVRWAGEGAARSRFLREARAMAGLDHPHVVRIYGFGKTNGQPYIVMEYVEGETLARRLSWAPRLTVEEALRISREVLQALAVAWSRGIVHRDVKPANILLDRDDHVKVADFGLAQSSSGQADATASGTVMGTAHYISPEQARGEETDFRSDVYSLGVVLYEMIAGQKPFAGANPMEVNFKQLCEPLPPIRDVCPDVPPGVARLVEAMTAMDRTARPATYADLMSSLTQAGARSGPLEFATSTMPSTPKAGRTLAKPARWAWGWVAAVAVPSVLAAGAVLGFGHWKARHGSFAVAVAPFYGADAESEKEGRVITSLVESELFRRLPEDDVDVLGVREVGKVVRSPRAAQALLQKLDVEVLVWGEALAFQGQVDLAARLTRRDGVLVESESERPVLAALAPDALELRRARASALAGKVAEIYSRR
jgi:hypothetical protein